MNKNLKMNLKTMRQIFVMLVVLCSSITITMAQTDTLITIYGKKFAPGVRVYLNNTLIQANKVNRINSKQIEVLLPLSVLKEAPPTLLSAKKPQGSVQAVVNNHIIRVENPSPARGVSNPRTLVVREDVPTVTLKTLAGVEITDIKSLAMTGERNAVSSVQVILQYSGVTLRDDNTAALQFVLAHSNRFSVWNSAGNTQLDSIQITSRQGSISLTMKFTGDMNVGFLESKLTVNILHDGNPATIPFEFGLQGFTVKLFKVLIAYTQKSGDSFVVYPSNGSSGQMKQINIPTEMREYAKELNQILQKRVTQNPQGASKLDYTRFVIYDTFVATTEQSPVPHLHQDIDILPTLPEVVAKKVEIPDIRCTILVVNSEPANWRGVPSDCMSGLIPQYVVVDVKYLDNFISLGSITLNAFFKSMEDGIGLFPLTAFRTIIDNEND